MMKKLIALLAVSTLVLSGCTWFQPAEEVEVVDDTTPVADETEIGAGGPRDIVDTEDYKYDRSTGELTSLKDNKVLHELEGHPGLVLTILGLEGNKLIVWETGNDNSPGPGWIHEIWVSDVNAKNIYYLDLDNTDKGLMPYAVPESKKEKEQALLDKMIAELSGVDETLKGINEGVEILLYSMEEADATLTQKETTFDYTVANLESMANECGTSHEEGYFDRLVEAYKNTPKYTYSFKYDGESQSPDTYTATVLLNRMEYTDFENVKADFDQCFAGGDMYPTAVSQTHILFVSTCGTGFADGSGDPVGCAEVKEAVEPTLKLNPEYKAI